MAKLPSLQVRNKQKKVSNDLSNRLSTGSNTGIGKVTALELSKRGAKVIMLCRDMKKAAVAAEEIKAQTKGCLVIKRLNLASLDSVRNCASEILIEEEKIDYLINNAGQ